MMSNKIYHNIWLVLMLLNAFGIGIGLYRSDLGLVGFTGFHFILSSAAVMYYSFKIDKEKTDEG